MHSAKLKSPSLRRLAAKCIFRPEVRSPSSWLEKPQVKENLFLYCRIIASEVSQPWFLIAWDGFPDEKLSKCFPGGFALGISTLQTWARTGGPPEAGLQTSGG